MKSLNFKRVLSDKLLLFKCLKINYKKDSVGDENKNGNNKSFKDNVVHIFLIKGLKFLVNPK